MVKLIHEVWEDPQNNSHAMFIRGAKGWRDSLSPQARLIRTFLAEGTFEAFRTHYRLMGFGEWKAPEGMEDEVYDLSDKWPQESRS
ncbi:MAG: hypothetical protein JSR60_08360 [Proteobacteria bacterium]|nr:hypothetical protein [Pseudomonadota bacterium]